MIHLTRIIAVEKKETAIYQSLRLFFGCRVLFFMAMMDLDFRLKKESSEPFTSGCKDLSLEIKETVILECIYVLPVTDFSFVH